MSQTPPGVDLLTRADLPTVVTGLVKKGAWNKADILLVTVAEGRLAVKDYAAKSLPIRWSGALQLSSSFRTRRQG